MATGARPKVVKRLKPWLPRREKLERSRILRPFAHLIAHPTVWRFNRRGVARGIALGLFLGFLLPFGAQTLAAAALAFGVRANLPVAVLGTTVTNPFTFPFVYFVAYKTGQAILSLKAGADRMVLAPAPDTALGRAWEWIVTTLGPTYLGLTVFAVVGAAVGYLSVNLAWRLSVSGRWRRRRPVAARPGRPAT